MIWLDIIFSFVVYGTIAIQRTLTVTVKYNRPQSTLKLSIYKSCTIDMNEIDLIKMFHRLAIHVSCYLSLDGEAVIHGRVPIKNC